MLRDWLTFGRSRTVRRSLDRELQEIFGPSGRTTPLDARHLARARAQIEVRLADSTPAASGWRRLAYGTLGGGGMWAGLVGAAAAHKAAAAAVGLSVLLGGGVAAEASGIGPAVREAVHVGGGDATPQLAHEDAPNAETYLSDEVPGALLSHVAPSGHFVMRGILRDTEPLMVETDDGDDTAVMTDEDTRIVIPGNREGTIDDIADDALVLVEGTVDGEEYTASLIVVLGRPADVGAGGPPAGVGEVPADVGKPADAPPSGLPVELPSAVPADAESGAPATTGDLPANGAGAGARDGVPPSDPPIDVPGRP